MKMNYDILLESANALFKDEPNTLSLLSNASAFLNENIPTINWVGFYLFDGTKLTLGPFQGKVACQVIEPGRGVCGTALVEKKTQVVKDVHAIDNHIACDPNSNSEVVIPIFNKLSVYGVLDIDSPVTNRFDSELVHFLEQFVVILSKYIDFSVKLV
jgi:L-methionine (R)-S-oxide reductase